MFILQPYMDRWNIPICNALHSVTTICNALHSVTTICNALHIQYWCIDGKYRMYVARLRNGGKDELLSCNKICKKKC